MSNEVTVDAKQVINMFDDLNALQQKAVYRKALRSASNILIKQTRFNLKSVVKSSITARSIKTGKSLSSGIKASINKEATQSTVHIMGDYRLKWFEMGTKIRKTRKKGLNRGSMIPKYFFKMAKASAENEVFSSMERIITEWIIKVNNKYSK